jgi:cell division protein FtsX
MKTLKRNGWTTNAAFLVMLLMLLATSLVLFLPAKAEAACCGHRTTEKYYSDASHTTLVGTCIDDECAGTYTCTGTITAYEVDSRVCCEICTP